MSKRKPKIADAALMAQVKAAQERFEALTAEAEGNLQRLSKIFAREERLIDLATKLAEEGPRLVLPPGPLPVFPAASVLEIQKLTYRSAMTDVLHALMRGDFSGLETECTERLVRYVPDLDDMLTDDAVPEC